MSQDLVKDVRPKSNPATAVKLECSSLCLSTLVVEN